LCRFSIDFLAYKPGLLLLMVNANESQTKAKENTAKILELLLLDVYRDPGM
jgi:hypothetical protein